MTVFWDQSSAYQWTAIRSAVATLGISAFGVEMRDPPSCNYP
jgi:hypothetical protein